ncbi:MAG: tail lysozyme [Bacteriophage sp.]|nr:MAG: tail lysozyme [Bacteriophage sp.]
MAWTPTKTVITRANQIHAILLSFGYSKESSAGTIANLIIETGYTLDPNINESGGGGYGLGQWTPKENVYKQGAILGISRSECDTLEGQAKIIAQGDVTGQWMNYVNLSYPGNPRNPLDLNTFKKSTDKEQCTTDFMAHWERPSEIYHHWDWRIEAVNTIYPHLTGEGGDGYQLAVLPIHYINVTQSEFTPNFSHAGTEAVDMAGEHPRYPLYAPCDIVCTGVDRGEAFVNWTSQKEVRCVDGTISFINFHIGHDDTHTQYNVGDTFKKGELFAHTGNSGHSFGDHLHIEVGKHKFQGMWSGGGLPNPAKLWDVFSSCDNVTKKTFPIVNAGGIPWKCDLNWVDGDGGSGGDGGDKTEDDYITLLLCDTLNGWKW